MFFVVQPNACHGGALVLTLLDNLLNPESQVSSVNKTKFEHVPVAPWDSDDQKKERDWLDIRVLEYVYMKVNLMPKESTVTPENSMVVTRQVSYLVKKSNFKVIYITSDEGDSDYLAKKQQLCYPQSIDQYLSNLTEDAYNFIKGDSYPSYSEFKNGNIHPELYNQSFENYYTQEFYVLPDDRTMTLEVKFHDILNGYELLEKISDFVGYKFVTDQQPLIDNYRKNFLTVDY
jgi:hypothetical protein